MPPHDPTQRPIAMPLDPTKRPSMLRSMATHLPTVAHLANGAAALMAILVGFRVLQVESVVRPEPVLAQEMKPLGAIKLERAHDDAGAHRIIDKCSPGAADLYFDWNGGPDGLGPGHFAFGTPAGGVTYRYIPVPRPGWEPHFRRMQYSGLLGTKLYEIRPPQSWSQNLLDAKQYKWAAACGVSQTWIEWWSSFRPADPGPLSKALEGLPHSFGLNRPPPLTNECAPGGRCFIISAGCNENAFSDLRNPRIATD